MGRREVPYIASHDGQAVLERRGGDQQVRIAMANEVRKPAPALSYLHIDRENAPTVQSDHAIQPSGERSGEGRIQAPLSGNALLYFPN